MAEVSRNDRRVRVRIDPIKWGKPRMAIVTIEVDETAGVGLATCNCGWSAPHHRRKVLEDKAQRHLDKRHHGIGMWM